MTAKVCFFEGVRKISFLYDNDIFPVSKGLPQNLKVLWGSFFAKKYEAMKPLAVGVYFDSII